MHSTRTLVTAFLFSSLFWSYDLASAQDGRKPLVAPSQTVGRFIIVISPHTNASTYLLDTETGKVWQPARFSQAEREPVVWQYMEKADNQEQLTDWLSRQRPKTKTTP